MNLRTPCLLIAAGGTGGHIFPALAVADILRAKGWRIEWLGAHGGLEERLVPLHGIPLHLLNVSGVRGKGLWSVLTAPWQIAQSVWRARQLIRAVQADVVLGMGGFASGPGAVAAKMSGRPLLIHEQNAIAGFTNKVLAKFADVVMAAFPGALTNAIVVGNPVRADLLALPAPAQRAIGSGARLRLLVIGGSRGAKIFNETVAPALALLSAEERPLVVHQVGRGQLTVTENIYGRSSFKLDDGSITVSEFIDDMAGAYGNADIVLCRAGALTVSELAAIGLPALFVPYPHAVDDHQTLNARYLSSRGGADVLPQAEFNAASLARELSHLHQHREHLQTMAEASFAAAIRDGAQRVADTCSALVEK